MRQEQKWWNTFSCLLVKNVTFTQTVRFKLKSTYLIKTSLSSGRDCRWGEGITSALFHPQYHDWGETLEQGTEPPTASRAPQQYGCPLLQVCSLCVCVHYFVCVHMDWLNAEHTFQVWVSILGHTSLLFHFSFSIVSSFLPVGIHTKLASSL